MDSRPGLAAIRPVLRWLLPLLLVLAASEMLVTRVLVRGGMFWLRDGRPGPALGRGLDDLGMFAYFFSLLVAAFLLFLLGVVTRFLRTWPSPLLGWLGVGLSSFALWSLLRSAMRFPDAALYPTFSLILAVGMLMTYFSNWPRLAPRAFSVLLASSLACSTFASLSRTAAPTGEAGWGDAARTAGELLALASGAMTPALLPRRNDADEERNAFSLAILAAIPSGLFFLLYARGPAPGRPAWELGWMGELPLPDGLTSLLYAGVLFLFLFALFRSLAEPQWRLQGYGLAFLFLAGIHYRIPYQHLMALTGLVLLTRGGLPEDPAGPVAASSPLASGV